MARELEEEFRYVSRWAFSDSRTVTIVGAEEGGSKRERDGRGEEEVKRLPNERSPSPTIRTGWRLEEGARGDEEGGEMDREGEVAKRRPSGRLPAAAREGARGEVGEEREWKRRRRRRRLRPFRGRRSEPGIIRCL